MIPLALTAAASTTDEAIQKKIYGSGIATNKEINDFMRTVKSVEKSVSETIKNEVKGQKGGLLCMLLGVLAANVLGIMLAGKT